MNKFQSKYHETAVRMDEAFLELLEKKDFEYITVKEICEKARVNRSTFYLHYEAVGDLLAECGEYISEKMSHYFDGVEVDLNKADADRKDLYFITPDNLIPWLTSIKDNKRLIGTILRRGASIGLESNFKNLADSVIMPVLRRYGISDEDAEYMMAFYMRGIMAIIQVWIQDQCRRDIDDIAKLIATCIPYVNKE